MTIGDFDPTNLEQTEAGRMMTSSSHPRVICHMMASADGRIGTPALFDVAPRRLALEAAERRADDMLWLRYRVQSAAASPAS
jgi:hypothetical protein